VRTAAALTAAASLTIARCLPREGERRNHAGDGPALRDPGGDFGSGVLVASIEAAKIDFLVAEHGERR